MLVTHAVHLLPRVDYIVVLKEGRVDEMGTFAELMSHNGAFAEFCREYLEKPDEEEEDGEEGDGVEEDKAGDGVSAPASARAPSSAAGGGGVATIAVTTRTVTPARTVALKDEEGVKMIIWIHLVTYRSINWTVLIIL